jgi:hypothetical protein
MKKKTIKNIKPVLKVIQHLKFIKQLEKNGNLAYQIVVDKMIDDIISHLKSEKLAKSNESDNIPKNWNKLIPRININVNDALGPIIEKYMLALKYALLGVAAGEKAEKAVEELGLKTYLPKGLLFQGFLDAVDTQSDYFSKALKIPKIKTDVSKDPFIEYTFKFIKEKTARYLDKTLVDMKTKALDAIQNIINEHNHENTANVHRVAHNLAEGLEETKKKREAVQEAVKAVAEHRLSLTKAKQTLKDTFKDYSTNWDLVVKTEVGMASASATSQAIMSLAGSKGGDVIVTIVSIEDDRVSQECKNWSRNPDGSLKYFRLTSLKPAGYNLGKKKAQWENCQPLRHFRCRCTLVYVPKGYRVDDFGSLVKLTENEEIKAEP